MVLAFSINAMRRFCFVLLQKYLLKLISQFGLIKDTEVWKHVFVVPKQLWKRTWVCTTCHINRQTQVGSPFLYHSDFPSLVITTKSPSGIHKFKHHERFTFPTYKTVSAQGILNFSHWTGFLKPKRRQTLSQICTASRPTVSFFVLGQVGVKMHQRGWLRKILTNFYLLKIYSGS